MADSGLASTSPVVHVPAGAAQHPIPVGSVQLDDPILAPLRDVLRTVSLPLQYERIEAAGVLSNFVRAVGGNDAPFRGKRYADSDLYKWIEAVSWLSADGAPDPELAARVDDALDLVEAAQHDDGYLNTRFSGPDAAERWKNVAGMNEFYVAGHLFHAAVAHARAFGSRRFLDIACRMADHMLTVFGPAPTQVQAIDSHPGIEMALVELGRETGNSRYVRLADFFLTLRGHGRLGGTVYNQDDVPFRDRDVFEGHAVCAGYLCCGAADLYLETGDDSLLQAQLRVWDNLTQRRMYVSGGFGSRWIDESVGKDFELPNARAYAETCAAVSSVMWNWRLLLTLGQSRFADLIEHTVYNGVLPGMALDGRTFFYQNPLQDDGGHRRSDWFEISCCPPNLSRLLGSIPGYVYTVADRSVSVHLYLQSSAEFATTDGRSVRIRQETAYPRDGRIRLRVETEGTVTLRLRVPSWTAAACAVRVNGVPVTDAELADGYLALTREWRADDVVELELPLTTRAVRAHPRVLENVDRVAVLRGPILYCAEGVDNPGNDLRDLAIDVGTARASADPNVLAGAVRLEVSGREHAVADSWSTALYAEAGTSGGQPDQPSGAATTVRLVPYHVWANRTPGPMQVWLRRSTATDTRK